MEGLVWCMPGVYGPTYSATHGPSASGDQFPILMRNRVHVRGVGARRCVIRGVNQSDPNFDPGTLVAGIDAGDLAGECNAAYQQPPRQVLVSFRYADKYANTTPGVGFHWWAAVPEVHEILDGFTFQGGDVQVAFDTPQSVTRPQTGRVSNCIFDLRHMPSASPPIEGPTVGLLLSMNFDNRPPSWCGYFDQRVHVAHNTFVLAEYRGSQWTNDARPGAVGLINVSGLSDPNGANRGLANVGLQNNLFRTRPANLPANTGTMAMLGIDAGDALVREEGSAAAFVATNAFATPRAGTTSGLFRSTPMAPVFITLIDVVQGWFSTPQLEPLYYDVFYDLSAVPCSSGPTCTSTSAALPTPAVALWNGAPNALGERDPGFVGEFLTHQPGTPVLGDYADWRLLPGSPLQNEGFASAVSTFQSGAEFEEPECEPLQVLEWDHEQFGNLRVVDGAPDIGFDEVQLGVMAGSYANHSYSHNRKGVLNPMVDDEQATRFLFLRLTAPGTGLALTNRTLTLRSNEIVAGTSFRAWTEPPGSLSSPTSVSGPPAGYQFLYTSVSNPVAWMGSYSATIPAPNFLWLNWQAAPGQSQFDLTLVQFTADDEGSGFASWVNVQPVVTGTGVPALLGSMQPEFR